MKSHHNIMRKRMLDTPKGNQKQWGRGKPRAQETLRSFSAPQAARSSPTPVRARPAARSLSATEQPVYREEPAVEKLEDKYDFVYCDVTSPSEEDSEKEEIKMYLEDCEVLEPGKIFVGPPKKVVTAMLPGSGLHRAQIRPAVKSFNTRVRDLASVLPAPRQYVPGGGSPPSSSAAAHPVRSRPVPSRWLDDGFKNDVINEDSPDLADRDEVGTTLRSEEEALKLDQRDQMDHHVMEKFMNEKLNSPKPKEKLIMGEKFDPMKIEEHLKSLKMGEKLNNLKMGNRLKTLNMEKQLKLDLGAGRKAPPAAGMLALEEFCDDEDRSPIPTISPFAYAYISDGSPYQLNLVSSTYQVAEFPPDTVVGGGGEMAALMENMKKTGLSTRQAQLSQLASSQTQVTSTTTQMVSNSTSSSSSSSSRQLASARVHHLTSAEMAKSDLSELKSSMTEMKKISSKNFPQSLRQSMENLVDAADPDNEPLVTFPPDPDTPPVPVVPPPPPGLMGAADMPGLNSSLDTMKFQQQHMTASSKTSKVVRENFSERAASELLQGDVFQGKGARSHRIAEAASHTTQAFKQEQRTLKAAEVSQQDMAMKVQTDSYSASSEQKAASASVAQQQQARQTVTSSGMFSSQEKHMAQSNMTITSKNMCTKSSMISSASQMSQLMNGSIKANEDDLSNMTFDDLDSLGALSSPKDVEMAIAKYSSRLDAFVKGLKRSQSSEISMKKASADLNKINDMIRRAWAVPTFGHELGYSLCNALRNSGGLDLLMTNCVNGNRDLQFSSAQLLEQCLTTENRAHVVDNGLEKVVNVACVCTKNANSVDHSRVGTGILEHLFKHSEVTCSDVIRLGGLDAVLFECRKNDVETLRHCAGALANLSLYGGAENQEAMIKRKVPMWLFPLAFHNDDNIKYYACLAIAVLVANTEIEAAVLKSGTLDLVEPFVTTHNPSEFARSNLAHAHGQSKNWLQRLVPVLSSKREEARNLAAFHFCMEAGIKKQQGNTEIFREIGAIEPLKKVASCPNAVASKYAAQALRLIGEELPHKLSQQVPLWSTEDVKEWVKQIGFSECANNFVESRVDGDLLLQLTEDNLKEDIGLINGIKRRRFTRELQNLKKMADYSSRDAGNLNTFLQCIGPEYSIYTYSMLNAGVDKECIRALSDEQLETECCITNSIHRLRILNSIRASESTLSSMSEESLDKSLDVFVSYRRSNGSQLASLLKVHLQLRGFSVFIDVERLEAGKFDNNLLQSIRQAKHFLLVLTPKALDRCIADGECKDWVHREIVAALQSQCNIIPIIDNFAWPEPEELPEDMRQVCHFNGVRWIHDYQDACVDKLERFMRGELKEGMMSRGPLGPKEGGSNAPPTPAPLTRAPPSYQRMHSSDSGKGSDKDQSNGQRD